MEWLVQILLERILQFRPRISKQGSVLVATSGWKAHLMCLGFAGRKVTIDPTQRLIRIAIRRFWFFTKSEVFTFDRILYVLSGYRDWSLSQLSVFGNYRDRGVFT